MSKLSEVHKWLGNAIVNFATEERGVVALIFALVTPILFGLFFMAYQFDEFNRYINRVQAAQLAGLEGAVHLPMAAQRKATAENISKKNMGFIKGTNLPEKLSDRWNQQAWEDEHYLYMATSVGATTPLHFLAKGSLFTVRMRIRLPDGPVPDPNKTCGVTNTEELTNFAEAIQYCGQESMSLNELRTVPNEERVKADQMALLNIGLGFFQGGNGGKAMTIAEIKAKYGIDVQNNKVVLLFNYRDYPMDPDAHDIETNLKNENNFPDVFFWLTQNYDRKFEGKDGNEKRQKYIEQYGDNRLFYSDWMLRDMSTWMNGIPSTDMGKNDNYRSVRGTFKLDGNTVQSVRIRVNRGSSSGKDRDGNDAQSFNREIDLTITRGAETDLDYVVEWRQTYAGTGLYGVEPKGVNAVPGTTKTLYFNKVTGNVSTSPSSASPEP